jgi:hypothetical protein
MAYIELTSSRSGKKFIANVSKANRFLDEKGDKSNENCYISGLTNNGGFYIIETYKEVCDLLYGAGVVIMTKKGVYE